MRRGAVALSLAGALTALAALPSLGGCSGKAAETCPGSLRCLKAGNTAEPGSLDPAHAFIKQEQTVIDDLLVGLTTFDADGRAAPGMAQSWTTSADGLTWRFRLREGARWSDGAPVTAEDFVFTFRRLVAPATGAGYAVLIYPFANAPEINRGKLPPESLGVSAPDPRTVEIRLSRPMPYLPDVLAHYGVQVVPPQAVRRWGDRWTEPGRFVSNGPYTLTSWRLGDRIVLTKNPRFYDAQAVCFDRVDYLPTGDMVAAERQVKRGELAYNGTFASPRIRYLTSERGGLRPFVHMAPWTDIVYLSFRIGDPALKDARVRQALSMAIDRDFIARRMLAAGQTPADAFVPPGLGALPAAPDWAGLSLEQRQGRARALLAAAGHGPGHPLTLELKAPLNTGIALMSAIASDWKAVGVDAKLARVETAVFFSELQLGDFQAAFTDWIADYLDPTDFLDLMRSDQAASNYGGYADRGYDALLDRAEAEPRPAPRAELLRQAERRMLEQAPIAPLYLNPSHNLVSPSLTGWRDNIYDVHPARYLCSADRPLRPGARASGPG